MYRRDDPRRHQQYRHMHQQLCDVHPLVSLGLFLQLKLNEFSIDFRIGLNQISGKIITNSRNLYWSYLNSHDFYIHKNNSYAQKSIRIEIRKRMNQITYIKYQFMFLQKWITVWNILIPFWCPKLYIVVKLFNK